MREESQVSEDAEDAKTRSNEKPSPTKAKSSPNGSRLNNGSRQSPSLSGSTLFEDLKGAQVRAMQSQGVKYKLRKSLPEESGQAQTLNREFSVERRDYGLFLPPLRTTNLERSIGHYEPVVVCGNGDAVFGSP